MSKKKTTKSVEPKKVEQTKKVNVEQPKKAELTKKVSVAEKAKMVNLFKTTYYFYRYWVKEILKDGKINDFRFVKDQIGWKGFIAVSSIEVDKAKKVLADYKAKNTDTVDLWW